MTLRRRFLLTMAATSVAPILFDTTWLFMQGRGADLVVSVPLVLVFFGALNAAGAWWLFRPIHRFAEGADPGEAPRARIASLPLLAGSWVAVIGVSYSLLVFFAEYSRDPAAPLPPAGEIISTVLGLILAYCVFTAMCGWLAAADFASDLKVHLARERGLILEPGHGRLWVRLLLCLFAVGVLPLALVIADGVLLAGDPKRVVSLAAADAVTALVGIVLTVFFITRGLSRPVALLAEAMAEVKAGVLRETAVVSDDEIGRLAADFNAMVRGLVERDFIRDTFGRYVEKEVADRALSGKIDVKGEERVATVLVSDIEAYTTLSEALPPAEVVQMLNEYFTVLVECVRARKGVVNKFIGDSVFAIFNAPLDDPDHAANAVRAAVEAQHRCSERLFGPRGLKLKTRIGINTGPVVAGNLGSKDRLEYTVIGDTANVAARLEALNKQHATALLVGERTRELAMEAFEFDPLGEVTLKGKSAPVRVFQVRGPRA